MFVTYLFQFLRLEVVSFDFPVIYLEISSMSVVFGRFDLEI